MARHWREVSATKEGLTFGGEKNAHRPAARAGEGHYRVHVDAINVWALFAIYLDFYEMLVHLCRGFCILKGLMRHHMAPVAGSVANAEEDGLILGFGSAQGFFSPGMPVDRIVLML